MTNPSSARRRICGSTLSYHYHLCSQTPHAIVERNGIIRVQTLAYLIAGNLARTHIYADNAAFTVTAIGWTGSPDAFRQMHLFVEAIDFQAGKIAARDNPADFAIADDGEMAEPTLTHQAQRVDCGAAKANRNG